MKNNVIYVNFKAKRKHNQVLRFFRKFKELLNISSAPKKCIVQQFKEKHVL